MGGLSKGGPKRGRRSGVRSLARRKVREPKSNPLIHPALVTLAKRLKSRRVRIDDTAGKRSALWSTEVVPRELVPFLTSLDVCALVDAVGRHPWLYWHPLVRQEVYWLMHLNRNPRAWDDVGWVWSKGKPENVAEVDQLLQKFVEAHAQGLLPHRRVAEWKDLPREPGTPGGMKNPCPATPDDDFIDAGRLYLGWYDLKQVIERLLAGDRKPSSKRYTHPLSREEYTKLGQQALERSQLQWTSRGGGSFYEEGLYRKDPWKVDLGPIAEWLSNEEALPRKMKHGEGRPARLAYALLGALLAEDPSQAPAKALEVKNRIDAHLAKPRRQGKASR
jgi:hypothetical protein